MKTTLVIAAIFAISLIEVDSLSDFTHVGPWAMSSRCRNPTFGMDGDVNTVLSTKKEFQPWVRYDLGTTKVVTAVKFTVRNDKCSPTLCGYEVRVGFDENPNGSTNLKCLYHPEIKQGESGYVVCFYIPGRYVFVTVPDKEAKIRFAEMKIMTNENQTSPVEKNLFKPESCVLDKIGAGIVSSQLSPDYGPDKALDNLDTTVAATKDEQSPWLGSNLGAVHNVFKVSVCLGKTAQDNYLKSEDFDITISNSSTPKESSENVNCKTFKVDNMCFWADCLGAYGHYVFVTAKRPGMMIVTDLKASLLPSDRPIINRYNKDLDFFNKWTQYVDGFGSPYDNYFMGLGPLGRLTTLNRRCMLHVLMKDNKDNLRAVRYRKFSVCPTKPGFPLTVGQYEGQVPNSLALHNILKFSTYDEDNDLSPNLNCAELSHGGFWYNGKRGNCYGTNLMGRYGKSVTPGDNMIWDDFTSGDNYLTLVRAYVLCDEPKV